MARLFSFILAPLSLLNIILGVLFLQSPQSYLVIISSVLILLAAILPKIYLKLKTALLFLGSFIYAVFVAPTATKYLFTARFDELLGVVKYVSNHAVYTQADLFSLIYFQIVFVVILIISLFWFLMSMLFTK